MEEVFLEEVVAFSLKTGKDLPEEVTRGGRVTEMELIATLHFHEALTRRSLAREWLAYLLESAPAGTA